MSRENHAALSFVQITPAKNSFLAPAEGHDYVALKEMENLFEGKIFADIVDF